VVLLGDEVEAVVAELREVFVVFHQELLEVVQVLGGGRVDPEIAGDDELLGLFGRLCAFGVFGLFVGDCLNGFFATDSFSAFFRFPRFGGLFCLWGCFFPLIGVSWIFELFLENLNLFLEFFLLGEAVLKFFAERLYGYLHFLAPSHQFLDLAFQILPAPGCDCLQDCALHAVHIDAQVFVEPGSADC
jgi:hypothetical protein